MPLPSAQHRIFIFLGLLFLCGLTALFLFSYFRRNSQDRNTGADTTKQVGQSLASYRGVHVYDNGSNFSISHGKHYSKDQYYFGQKWQCVEFVKRFYFQAHHHRMPSVWGHAKDFYDPKILHGQINPQRDMTQYENGGSVKPQADDLLVFNYAPYGHVAIVSSVSDHEIEVIQQNVNGVPRSTLPLKLKNGNYTVGIKTKPIGWLRLEKKNASQRLNH